MRCALGVDLGGTNIAVGVVTEEGKILWRRKVPTEAEKGPDHVTSKIEALAREAMGEYKIEGIGIGAPGPLDSRRGVVIKAPNLPSWENYPIKEKLEGSLGVRVELENDANAAIWGEKLFGVAKHVSYAIMLTLGTGIGGGIIIDGKLYRGASLNGAELGHMTIGLGGPICGCGKRGCFEAYASATALSARASAVFGRKVTAKELVELAISGDTRAIAIWDEYTTYLAIGIGNLLNIFAPEMVILGGGVAEAGDFLLIPVRKKVPLYAFPINVENVRIVKAALGNDGPILGAAALIFESSWSPGQRRP